MSSLFIEVDKGDQLEVYAGEEVRFISYEAQENGGDDVVEVTLNAAQVQTLITFLTDWSENA